MCKVKICGIRLVREVEALNRHLPDYVGFVFAQSRRSVLHEEAARLVRQLDGCIIPVGVFADASKEEILKAVQTAGIKVVQLHGNEAPPYLQVLRNSLPPCIEIWKAFRTGTVPPDLSSYQGLCERLLFDGSVPGNGKPFDYSLLPASMEHHILAGGLNPNNIKEAIQKVQPFAVDASSGVEGLDGFKDEALLKSFIATVKEATTTVEEEIL